MVPYMCTYAQYIYIYNYIYTYVYLFMMSSFMRHISKQDEIQLDRYMIVPNIVFKYTCACCKGVDTEHEQNRCLSTMSCRPLRSNFVDNLRGFQSQNKLKKAGSTQEQIHLSIIYIIIYTFRLSPWLLWYRQHCTLSLVS